MPLARKNHNALSLHSGFAPRQQGYPFSSRKWYVLRRVRVSLAFEAFVAGGSIV